MANLAETISRAEYFSENRYHVGRSDFGSGISLNPDQFPDSSTAFLESKIIIVSLQLKNQKEKYVSWALEPKMDPKLHKLHLVWLGPPWPLRFFHSSIPMQTSELLYHVIPVSPLSLV